MLNHQKSRGIAIIAVLLSAVIFLGIIVAITGTLSISSRRTTADQRVTLEAQYAAESGLSRVIAEAQNGLMKNWTAVLLKMKPSTAVTESDITQLAKYFCNTPAATVLTKPVGSGDYCTTVSGTDNYASPTDYRYSLFSKLISNGTADDTTDSDGRSDQDYVVNGTNLLAGRTEAEFWRDVFSPNKIRYTQSISSNAQYEVGFGFEPVGVRVVDGAVYRFIFKAADASSTGTFKNGTSLVSERKTTRAFQEQYYVDLAPPSFAYFLLLTNSQKDSNGNPIYITDSAINNGPVHTNGNYFFKGRPYFGDELTSSGCADATCTAATRVIGATYNDGSPNPNDNSYNPQLVTVNYQTNPNATINFPGYDPSIAGYASLTGPETVMSNTNGAANNPPAKPWNYTGRFDRGYEKFPTNAIVQKDKAIEKGINISPPNINNYTDILGYDHWS
jgi:Domain of unknown function (DUF4900)